MEGEIPIPQQEPKKDTEAPIFTYLKGLVIKNHYHQAYLKNIKFCPSQKPSGRD